MNQFSQTLGSILAFDLFAYVPNLTFDRKTSHKTFIGCFFSYLFLILTILAVIEFSDDVVNRQSPSLIVTEKILSTNDDSPKTLFGPRGERVALGLFQDTTLIPLDPSYFSIRGYFISYKSNQGKSFGVFNRYSKRFNIVPCSKDQLPIEKEHFSGVAENTVLCFGDLNETLSESKSTEDFDPKEIYIEGFFGSKTYTSLLITFHTCKNETSNIVCKPQEEIVRKIDSIYIGGFYLNKYLHAQSYANPIQENIYWFYTKPDSKISKDLQVNFQTSLLETDDGLIVASRSAFNFTYISNTNENICTQVIENELPFLKMTFQIDPQQKIYSRKYKRLQDVAAEVGASMKFLLLIMAFILKPIVKKSFIFYFADCVLPEKEARSIKENNISSRLKLLCKLLSPQKRINHEKASEYIINKIDIISLFNKMIEIENLSQLILEKNQLMLFKYYCYDFRAALKDDRDPIKKGAPDRKKLSLGISQGYQYQREAYLNVDSISRAFNSIKDVRISQSSIIQQNFIEMYKSIASTPYVSLHESPPGENAPFELSEKTIFSDMEEKGSINNIVNKNKFEVHKLPI